MKQKGSKIFVYSCIAPALLLFAVFMIYPTISVFRMSLYEWGGLSARRTFVGLKNFKVLLDDRFFLRSFQNTVLIITLVTIITLSIAIIFAYILIRERIKGENFFRVVFYIPNILSIAVIAAVFSAIYAPDQGLINGLGRLLNPTLILGSIFSFWGTQGWSSIR